MTDWIEVDASSLVSFNLGQMIEVRYRNETREINFPSQFNWCQYGDEWDIIAYRVVSDV